MSISNETGKLYIRAHISKLEFGKPMLQNGSFMASKYRQQ